MQRPAMLRRGFSSRGAIERLEPRRLLSGQTATQVLITPKLVEIDARSAANLPIVFKLHDVTGTIALDGTNLAEQTSGNHATIAGNLIAISSILISDSTPASSLVLQARGGIELGGFEDAGPMKLLDLSSANMAGGSYAMLAAPALHLGNGTQATIQITQNLPVFSMTGGNFTSSQVNITAGSSLPAQTQQVLDYFVKKWQDSTLKYAGRIDNLQLDSASQTSPGAASFTVGAIKSIRVGTDFGATLWAGSIGTANIGGSLLGATINLTNPLAADSLDLKSLVCDKEISGSTINSAGSVGSIGSMFTLNSQIRAGVAPGYVFDQPSSDVFSSAAAIGSFTSFCPIKNAFHFVNSDVEASQIGKFQTGNFQTQNNGIPFGIATNSLGNLSAIIPPRPVRLKNVTTTAQLNGQLSSEGQSNSMGNLLILVQPSLVLPEG